MKAFLAIAGLVALLGVPKANATIEVRIINVVGGVAVGDTGWTAGTGNGIDSAIFTGTVGNYTVTSDIAVSHLTSNPLLDMAYSATSQANPNPGTIIIEAMANGYNEPIGSSAFEFVDNGNSGFASGTFTDRAWGGNSNNICPGGPSACWNGTTNPAPSGTPTVLALIAPGVSVPSPNVWNVDQFGGAVTTNPFALGIAVTLTNPTGLSTMSGDAKINSTVPEPASVALLGGVLLLVGTKLRRRARRA